MWDMCFLLLYKVKGVKQMEYRTLIIEMLNRISNEAVLELIYRFCRRLAN